MTPLPSAAIGALAPSIAPEPTKSRSLPLTLRLIQYTSDVGVVGAIATTVYGIAMSIIPWIALGSLFIATSLSSFYLIHKIANLQEIEEDAKKIQALNASLAEKNAQIENLTNQIKQISDDLSAKEKEFIAADKARNADESKLNDQLKDAEASLSRTEIDAKADVERATKDLAAELAALQKQSDQDQKRIDQLNQTLAKMKTQNDALNASLADLQKQVSTYQQQIAEYTRLNTQLQGQIQQLKDIARTPDVDVSTINAHAAHIEDAIAKQKAVADQTAKAAADINTMLDALTRRLPAPKPATVGK